MKIIQTNRDNLLKPLLAVSGIVEKRHTLPILSNVLLERAGETARVLATDLEIQVTTGLLAEEKGPDYRVTTSARKLQEILRALPENAEVSLISQTGKLQVKSGKSSFSLQTLPAEDFPEMPATNEKSTKVVLQQKVLKRLLLLVQYAMAQQDIRYYLNGLLFVLVDDTLKAVATDGHRLAYASISLPEKVSAQQDIIVPRKAIQELVKLLTDTEDPITMEFSASQVRFTVGQVELVTKVIDGKFPDYGRVIPEGYKKSFDISRIELQQALQRVAILSNEKFRGVRWVLSDAQLRITCTNVEQEEAFEDLQIPYKGDALDIGFNVTYLLDALSNLSCETVVCAFGDANSSMLITASDDASYRYVVMPMRI